MNANIISFDPLAGRPAFTNNAAQVSENQRRAAMSVTTAATPQQEVFHVNFGHLDSRSPRNREWSKNLDLFTAMVRQWAERDMDRCAYESDDERRKGFGQHASRRLTHFVLGALYDLDEISLEPWIKEMRLEVRDMIKDRQDLEPVPQENEESSMEPLEQER